MLSGLHESKCRDMRHATGLKGEAANLSAETYCKYRQELSEEEQDKVHKTLDGGVFKNQNHKMPLKSYRLHEIL